MLDHDGVEAFNKAVNAAPEKTNTSNILMCNSLLKIQGFYEFSSIVFQLSSDKMSMQITVSVEGKSSKKVLMFEEPLAPTAKAYIDKADRRIIYVNCLSLYAHTEKINNQVKKLKNLFKNDEDYYE